MGNCLEVKGSGGNCSRGSFMGGNCPEDSCPGGKLSLNHIFSIKMAKRRKVNKEKRVFKDSWADLYFFVEQKEKPICLICNESVSVNKEYNLKRHHETKHKGYNEFKPRERKEKLEKLKSNLDRQQTIFKKQNNETEKNTKTNYIVSYLIAKKMKPFTEREFIDKCMMSFVREVCSE